MTKSQCAILAGALCTAAAVPEEGRPAQFDAAFEDSPYKPSVAGTPPAMSVIARRNEDFRLFSSFINATGTPQTQQNSPPPNQTQLDQAAAARQSYFNTMDSLRTQRQRDAEVDPRPTPLSGFPAVWNNSGNNFQLKVNDRVETNFDRVENRFPAGLDEQVTLECELTGYDIPEGQQISPRMSSTTNVLPYFLNPKQLYDEEREGYLSYLTSPEGSPLRAAYNPSPIVMESEVSKLLREYQRPLSEWENYLTSSRFEGGSQPYAQPPFVKCLQIAVSACESSGRVSYLEYDGAYRALSSRSRNRIIELRNFRRSLSLDAALEQRIREIYNAPAAVFRQTGFTDAMLDRDATLNRKISQTFNSIARDVWNVVSRTPRVAQRDTSQWVLDTEGILWCNAYNNPTAQQCQSRGTRSLWCNYEAVSPGPILPSPINDPSRVVVPPIVNDVPSRWIKLKSTPRRSSFSEVFEKSIAWDLPKTKIYCETESVNQARQSENMRRANEMVTQLSQVVGNGTAQEIRSDGPNPSAESLVTLASDIGKLGFVHTDRINFRTPLTGLKHVVFTTPNYIWWMLNFTLPHENVRNQITTNLMPAQRIEVGAEEVYSLLLASPRDNCFEGTFGDHVLPSFRESLAACRRTAAVNSGRLTESGYSGLAGRVPFFRTILEAAGLSLPTTFTAAQISGDRGNRTFWDQLMRYRFPENIRDPGAPIAPGLIPADTLINMEVQAASYSSPTAPWNITNNDWIGRQFYYVGMMPSTNPQFFAVDRAYAVEQMRTATERLQMHTFWRSAANWVPVLGAGVQLGDALRSGDPGQLAAGGFRALIDAAFFSSSISTTLSPGTQKLIVYAATGSVIADMAIEAHKAYIAGQITAGQGLKALVYLFLFRHLRTSFLNIRTVPIQLPPPPNPSAAGSTPRPVIEPPSAGQVELRPVLEPAPLPLEPPTPSGMTYGQMLDEVVSATQPRVTAQAIAQRQLFAADDALFNARVLLRDSVLGESLPNLAGRESLSFSEMMAVAREGERRFVVLSDEHKSTLLSMLDHLIEAYPIFPH